MAVTMRSKAAFANGVARSAPSRSRVVVAASQGAQVEKVSLAAGVLAAAALLASPVDAKVILQQPNLKKAFVSEEIPRAPASSSSVAAPAATSAPRPAPAPKVQSSSEGGLDPRVIALPGAIASVAGLGFLATKVDSGFEEFLNRTVVRNSNDYAGFEPEIKSTYTSGIYGDGNAAAVAVAGTKKVKAVAKGKKGGFFGKK